MKFELSIGNKEPWTEEQIKEFLQNGIQSANDHNRRRRGTKSVSEMKPVNIFREGNIVDVNGGSLIVEYEGETFEVTIEHPEL